MQQPTSARNAAFPPSGKTPTMYGQLQHQQSQHQHMRPPINTFSTDSYDRYSFPNQQQPPHQQQHYPNLPRGQSSPMRVQRPGEMSSGRPSEASSEVSSDVSSTNTPVGRTITRVQSQSAAAPSSPQEAWTCTVCTLKNNPNFLSCEACRSVRIR